MNQQQTYLFNIEYEQRVLGCLMYYSRTFYDISGMLEADDFYRDIHQTIYTLICRFMNKGEHADPLMIAEALEQKGVTSINDLPPFSYLVELTNSEPTSAGAKAYARRIVQLAELRRLRDVNGQIAALTASESVLSGEEDALEKAESMIMGVKRRSRKNDFTTIGAYMPTYIERLTKLTEDDGKLRGIPTGFPDLDVVLGGLQRGSLYIPAARPRVGKTTWAQNVSYTAAKKHGKRVAFFSCEMSLDDLMDRFVSIHTGIDSQKLRNGRISDDEFSLVINETLADFEKMGIYINYTPGITVSDLKSQARRLVAQHNIDLIVVDYLQLLKAMINGKRILPREQEVAEIAREMKQLAGELNVPVIAPAQINREIEHRPAIKEEGDDVSYRMPQLSDLRESGELEQSADVVMFLARSEEKPERVKIVVAKHRNGPEGELDLYFKGDEMRFYPLTQREK